MIKNVKNKNIKWWIGITSCVILFSIIGIFAYIKMSFLWKGVQIEAKIEKNENNSSVAKIIGKAKNATILTLNGREIFIDKDGRFSEDVALLPGLSIMTIDAQDKFGKSKEKKFQIVYKENAKSVAFVDTVINTN